MKRRKTQGFVGENKLKDSIVSLLAAAKVKVQEFNAEVITPAVDRGRDLTKQAKQNLQALAEHPRVIKAKEVTSASAEKMLAVAKSYFPSSAKEFWAVDIAPDGIRLARLSLNDEQDDEDDDGPQYCLRDYYRASFDVDLSKRNSADSDRVKLEVLRSLLERAGVKNKDVVLSINGEHVFTRVRTLLPVPRSKVAQSVKYQIQQQIPFGLDDLYIDYEVMKVNTDGSYQVLMAAIKQSVVDRFIEILTAAECRVHGVTIAGIAAYNWLKWLGAINSTTTPTALVLVRAGVGEIFLEIVCEVDNQFHFTRPLKITSSDKLQAARVKLEQENKKLSEAGQEVKKIPELTEMIATEVVSKVSQSFSYFRSIPGGKAIKQVMVFGAEAISERMGGVYLEDLLTDQLGLQVVYPNILRELTIKDGDILDPDQMAVVLGLALSCQQNAAIEINLLPKTKLQQAVSAVTGK